MSYPIILAHGLLGAYDELIFAGVGVVFVAMMAISWWRSRNAPTEMKEDADVSLSDGVAEGETADHYRLD